MKTIENRKVVAAVLLLLALGFSAPAASLTNNFDVSRDYGATGVVGDTNWDGVYLGFGDITRGGAGGSGNGIALAANANVYFPGFLTLQQNRGDWSAAGDDGFFLWKLVSGDFDVSVESVPPWDARPNHFAGLFVRAYNTNNSGAPVSFSSATASENWLALFRCQQFGAAAPNNGIGEIRQATNAVNFENTFTDLQNPGTNETRFYRITRTGDTFKFYWKTNAVDAWFLITNAGANGGYVATNGSVTRPDWAGQPVQVGIAQALFNNLATPPQAYFTDFELSGSNVNLPAMPAAPSGLTITPVNSNSVSLSWTPGAGSAGSLVMVRANAPLIANPIQGYTYAADANFQNTNTLLSAGNNHVVYVGAGNSVTVTGLGGSNNTYNAAVFSYSGSGSSTVYNTASPATNSSIGPGRVSAVSFTVAPTILPIGGAGVATVTATYNSGDSYNVSTDPNIVFSGYDPAVILVANGVMNGLTNGTTPLVATYAGVSGTNTVSVRAPAFTDAFATTQDYLNNGLLGSTWDGLFLNFGDVPGGAAGADGNGATTVLDAQISSTNGLSITSLQSTWEAAGDDGPFLFKKVPGTNNAVSGDFEVVVHVNSMNNLNGVVVGLMARLYNPANGGPGPNAAGAEYHVNYWKVQNGTTSVRRTQNGGNTTILAAGPAAASTWLLMARVNSTNFLFFEKANAADPWNAVPAATTTLATAANNAPMQVGIAEQSTLGVNAVAVFNGFLLDAAGLTSAAPPPPPAKNFSMTLNPATLAMTLNWVAADTNGAPVQSAVVMRPGGPVTAQPTLGASLTGNSVFGTGTGLGDGNYVVFVSANPPASTNNTVTVTGLTPGVTYYAAVYTFVGTGAARVFNNVVPSIGASGSLADGALVRIDVVLPANGVPAGGIAQPQVLASYTGGAVVDRTTSATFASGNPTVLVVGSGGLLTGLTNGTATLTAVYGGLTNSASVTVHAPTFTDNFSVSHDYHLNGVAGTPYDGIYDISDPSGLYGIPGSPYAPQAGEGAAVADANITSNNVLTITASGNGWEGGNVGGFLLFKYVPADFQTAIHIRSFDVANYNQPGLLARVYGVDTSGKIGAPAGTIIPNANGTNDLGEYWVSLTRFDEYNIGTYARRTIDGGVSTAGAGGTSQNTQTDQGDTNFWLLIVRTMGSEFDLYKRLNATDPWKQVPNKTHYSLPQFAGKPMQVGPMAGPWGASRTVMFENFMLDVAPGVPGLQASRAGNNLVVSWPTTPGYTFTLKSSSDLVPSNWQPVPLPQQTANGRTFVVIPISGGASYFRLFK